MVLGTVCFCKNPNLMPLYSTQNETSYLIKKICSVKGENTLDKFAPKPKFQNRKLKSFHFQIAKGELHATKKLIYFSLPENTTQTQPELQNGFFHPQIAFFGDRATHPKHSPSQNMPAVLCPTPALGTIGALRRHRSRAALGGLQGSEH